MRTHALALLACLAVSAGIARAEQPRDDYQLHCMGCHGEQGRGSRAGKVPSFRSDLGRFLATPEGREFVQRVPGVSLSALDSTRLAALMNWIVREFADPARAAGVAPFTPEELERQRRQPLLDVGGVRAAVLARSPS